MASRIYLLPAGCRELWSLENFDSDVFLFVHSMTMVVWQAADGWKRCVGLLVVEAPVVAPECSWRATRRRRRRESYSGSSVGPLQRLSPPLPHPATDVWLTRVSDAYLGPPATCTHFLISVLNYVSQSSNDRRATISTGLQLLGSMSTRITLPVGDCFLIHVPKTKWHISSRYFAVTHGHMVEG